MDKLKANLIGLDSATKEERLSALAAIAKESGSLPVGDDVNNHIHTTYSFSPYSPAKAVYIARTQGLRTAGIMDHDSIAGAIEFIEAGKIMGIGTTVGVECRVSMRGTFLENVRINNPDQKGVAYCALHGIPRSMISRTEDFFRPYIQARMVRNRAMTENINRLLHGSGISLDFEGDVVAGSMYHAGGTVTERHILYALSLKLLEKYTDRTALIDYLRNGIKIEVSRKAEAYLLDAQNPYMAYDLLGVLKTDLVSKIYIDADDECPHVEEFIRFAKETGSISAYAYLGDVGESVTGDKRAQEFEDGYLDALFDLLKALGFFAVTYMPSRNTDAQLARVRKLCEEYGMFQISGEDINQPRQKFICEALRKPEFKNLVESAYALIGHEKEAEEDLSAGMFSERTVMCYPDLKQRTAYFSKKSGVV